MWPKILGCLQVFLAASELKLRGFYPVCAALLEQPLDQQMSPEQQIRARQAYRTLLASNRFSFSTCLSRSVVLCRRLRAQGLPARLMLGANTQTGFSAHAWVELPGATLGHANTTALDRMGAHS